MKRLWIITFAFVLTVVGGMLTRPVMASETADSVDLTYSRKFYVSVNSNYALNYESNDRDNLNGFALAAKAGYDLNRYVGVEVESGWMVYERLQDSGFETGNLHVFPLLGNLVLRYPMGRLVPYAAGGLGVYFFSLDKDIKGTTATLDIDSAAFGGKVAAGMDYYLTDRLALNFETGVHFIKDPDATLSQGGLNLTTPSELDNWYIGGGVKFRF